MRPLLLLCVALSSSAFAQGRHPTALLPPFAESEAAAALSHLIQARASTLLERGGKHSYFHGKQIAAMAEAENLPVPRFGEPEVAAIAAKHLGATRWAYGRLKPAKEGWTFEHSADGTGGKKGKTVTTALPKDWAKAVAVGSVALASNVAALDKAALKFDPAVEPATASSDAMQAYGKCHEVLIQQPISIDAPVAVSLDAVKSAIVECERAVKADAKFNSAKAALGLAYALAGRDKEAIAALDGVTRTDELPLFAVARFWLVTRYQSNDAGTEVLAQSVTKQPGTLLLQGYLGETLNALGRFDRAFEVWSNYLKAAPSSTYVATSRAKTIARLGKLDEAIAATEVAAKENPKSLSAQLQLGSRLIDKGDFQGAAKVLRPIGEIRTASYEAQLRLGYALLNSGATDEAIPYFQRAAAAEGPTHWRTRGRARYDLALIAVKKGDKDKAYAELSKAIEEGYRPSKLDPSLAPLAQRDSEDLKQPQQQQKKIDLSPKPSLVPDATPFHVQPSGELDLNRAKSKPPEGFTTIHFGG